MTDALVTERFLVVCNWKRKGDRLLRNGRSELATFSYKTALLKLESLNPNWRYEIESGTFEGYGAREAVEVLKFRLQASVSASYLRSHKYKDAVKWGDDILKHHHYLSRCPLWWLGPGYHSCDPATLEKYKNDEVKAHYCYSLALMHMGDTSRAIEQMEIALKLDPSEGTVFAQLINLRRRAEKEKLKRERRKLENGGVED